MKVFTRREMQRRLHDRFSILLSAADTLQMFGEKLKLYRIAEPTQANNRPCLILNLSEKPNGVTPSVNCTINREITPELMQFGLVSPHILQAI